MALSFIQQLAIYNNGNLPNSINSVQKWFKILAYTI